MRYAVFSDIHANLEALDAVLQACRCQRIDAYLCVGDIVGYGADPAACIDRTRSVANVIVAGNHDWAVCGQTDIATFNPFACAAIEWTRTALSAPERAFLASLPLTFANADCTLTHGTLHEPEQFHYLTDGFIAWPTFRLLQTTVCFIGHTHIAGVFMEGADRQACRISDTAFVAQPGNRYIVNVGSVGQPRDSHPAAAYCIFDSQELTVNILRVDYDIAAARKKIIAAGLPRFLGDRLLSGS
ncbi:MAG TPA: metallophosphoesterase family protein [Candidatus Omnitrophota bacterium]|nr:metallophosphoesterase family protein [Candidatus Omnitrophota bacterium]HRZ14450.1 metallophosphoesterase family protein [Candidatus Omnitrophota bacterium]